MVLPEPPYLPADVLCAFVRRRKKLNECLDETRVAIDRWLERQPMPPPFLLSQLLKSCLQNAEIVWPN